MGVFSQIHEIVFHGNGGYSWETVYQMPIWLRRLTYHKIKAWYDKQKEQEEQAAQPTSSKPQIARPNINPSYSTKAPSK